MPTKSVSSSRYSAVECLDNLDSGVANLMSIYALATKWELEKGIDWYPSANRDAHEIAKLYGLDVDVVIKVAAAISPKCPWQYNMDSAAWVIRQFFAGCYIPDYEEYRSKRAYLARVANLDPSKPVLAEDSRVKAPPYGGLKANVIKALWILQGHDVLKGPKVNEFYLCVKNWETHLGACVDSHAIQCWFGVFDGGTFGVAEKYFNLIRADYIKAAQLVGLSPLQFQAVLWIVKKRVSKQMGLVRR